MSRLWASLRRMLDRTPRLPAPKVSNSPDWRQCEDSARMLTLLGVHGHSRKARLLACGCARRLWDSLSDPCRRIVESQEWNVEHVESGQLAVPGEYTEDGFLILLREAPDAIRGELLAMMECLFWYDRALAEEVPPNAARAAGRRAQAPLVRNIFSPPRLPAVEPSWMAWHGGLVARLALTAYQDRQLPLGLLENDRLLVLADALEEAGCAETEILGHLRAGGEHVRGCFVLDLILAKD